VQVQQPEPLVQQAQQAQPVQKLEQQPGRLEQQPQTQVQPQPPQLLAASNRKSRPLAVGQ
jgi:hypothetical protein